MDSDGIAAAKKQMGFMDARVKQIMQLRGTALVCYSGMFLVGGAVVKDNLYEPLGWLMMAIGIMAFVRLTLLSFKRHNVNDKVAKIGEFVLTFGYLLKKKKKRAD